jgi:hypothetical protein
MINVTALQQRGFVDSVHLKAYDILVTVRTLNVAPRMSHLVFRT